MVFEPLAGRSEGAISDAAQRDRKRLSEKRSRCDPKEIRELVCSVH